uniref:Chimadanin anti-thrombin-like protein n=1 Tax=Rhipicephalus sanguineus TaxID=34632 RepID=C9W1D6_RHISA
MVARRLTLLLIFALVAAIVLAQPKRKQLSKELREGVLERDDEDYDNSNDDSGPHEGGETAKPRLPSNGGGNGDFEKIPVE